MGTSGGTSGGGGGGFTPYVRRAYITAGDNVLSNAAWTVLPAFSLAIPAAVGDEVELNVSCMRDTNGFYDLAVIVGGVAVRCASNDTATPATEGLPSLYQQPGTFRTHAGVFGFTATANDISGGNVTFAVMGKGTSGVMFASAAYPFFWRAKNIGPVR